MTDEIPTRPPLPSPVIAFYVILSSILLGDVTWWRWADKRLRRSLPWRVVLALFMGIQLAYFGWFLLWPDAARRTHPWLPRPFTAAVYLWSLITLPISLITIGAASAEQAIARRRSRALPESPARSAAAPRCRPLLSPPRRC